METQAWPTENPRAQSLASPVKVPGWTVMRPKPGEALARSELTNLMEDEPSCLLQSKAVCCADEGEREKQKKGNKKIILN